MCYFSLANSLRSCSACPLPCSGPLSRCVVACAAAAHCISVPMHRRAVPTPAQSALDILSLFIFSWAASQEAKPDPFKFPIGKSAIEVVANVGFAALMGGAAMVVLSQGVQVLATGLAEGAPSSGASITLEPLLIVGAAVLAKIGLWLVCRGYADRSLAAAALAQDHWNDTMSTSFTLLAILIVSFFPSAWWVDPGAAVVMSLIIIRTWWGAAQDHTEMLLGRWAEPMQHSKVLAVALLHDARIQAVEHLNAYTYGSRTQVELDIVLPPTMPHCTAHDIAEGLQFKIESLPFVARAYVHIDWRLPDEGGSSIPEHIVPWDSGRSTLLAALRQQARRASDAPPAHAPDVPGAEEEGGASSWSGLNLEGGDGGASATPPLPPPDHRLVVPLRSISMQLQRTLSSALAGVPAQGAAAPTVEGGEGVVMEGGPGSPPTPLHISRSNTTPAASLASDAELAGRQRIVGLAPISGTSPRDRADITRRARRDTYTALRAEAARVLRHVPADQATAEAAATAASSVSGEGREGAPASPALSSAGGGGVPPAPPRIPLKLQRSGQREGPAEAAGSGPVGPRGGLAKRGAQPPESDSDSEDGADVAHIRMGAAAPAPVLPPRQNQVCACTGGNACSATAACCWALSATQPARVREL